MLGNCPNLLEGVTGHLRIKSEKFLYLPDENDDRDSAGESGDHRIRNDLDQATELERTHGDEKNSGHDRRQRETGVTVNRDDTGENGNECAGRPPDLHFAAAKRGDDCPGNDRSPQTLRWRDARSDAETDREWQRDYADRYACGQIGEKSPAIVIAQTLDQFRFKKLHCWRSPICHSARSRGISSYFLPQSLSPKKSSEILACFRANRFVRFQEANSPFVAQPSWLWGQRASCPLKTYAFNKGQTPRDRN